MQEEFKELEDSLKKELEQTGTKLVKGEFVTYRTILYEGILGDFATEWWTKKDFDKHEKRVAKLKADGVYGKPWICDLTLKHYPLYDTPSKMESDKSLESYRMTIINFNK